MEPLYYQVAIAAGHEGCQHCKGGQYWTVIFFEAGSNEATEIGTSWMDEEMAQDVCDLMNMAYDAGCDSDRTGEP